MTESTAAPATPAPDMSPIAHLRSMNAPGNVQGLSRSVQPEPPAPPPGEDTGGDDDFAPNDDGADDQGEPRQKYKVYGKTIELTEKQARDAVEKYYASEKKFEELKSETVKAKEAQRTLDNLRNEVQGLWKHAATSADNFGDVIERIAKLSNNPQLVDSAIQWVVNLANENALPEDQRRFRQEQRKVGREKQELDQWRRQQEQQQASAQENAIVQQVDQALPTLLQQGGLPDRPATRYRVLELAKFYVQDGKANALNLAVERTRQEYERAGMLPALGTPSQRQSAPKRRATPESVRSASGQPKAPTYKSFEEFERERKASRRR